MKPLLPIVALLAAIAPTAEAQFSNFDQIRSLISAATADGVGGDSYNESSSTAGAFSFPDLTSDAATGFAFATTTVSQTSNIFSSSTEIVITFDGRTAAETGSTAVSHPWSVAFFNSLSFDFTLDGSATWSLALNASSSGSFPQAAPVFAVFRSTDLLNPIFAENESGGAGVLGPGSYRVVASSDRGLSGGSGTISGLSGASDVSLTFTAVAVPEPHLYGFALGGFLLALIISRKRRGLAA